MQMPQTTTPWGETSNIINWVWEQFTKEEKDGTWKLEELSSFCDLITNIAEGLIVTRSITKCCIGYILVLTYVC